MLAHSITLTPGTTSIDVDKSNDTLYIHSFDGADPAAVRKSIDKTLKKPLLGY